jgi:hypothetical protein
MMVKTRRIQEIQVAVVAKEKGIGSKVRELLRKA